MQRLNVRTRSFIRTRSRQAELIWFSSRSRCPAAAPVKPAKVLFALFKRTRVPVAEASVSSAEALRRWPQVKGDGERN